jgi:calcium-dependent protein kinase
MRRRRFHELFKGVKKIGKGNFASVYLTQRISDSKYFAVKAFQKETTFKPTNGKEGLENEIKILRKLNHPNIVHLEGIFESDNSIYMVMELVQGRSLGELLD